MKAERAVPRTGGGCFDRSHAVDKSTLAPDTLVTEVVGYAAITRDSVPMFEARCGDLEHAVSVREAERIAAAEPGRDWRIHLTAPLDERHYRPEADGHWRIYRRGYGLN